MIDLEQELKKYYENHYFDYHPEMCEGYDEYLRRLKALEASPEAAKRPPRRRRYMLPVAAAIALAVALGGWYAWQHAVTPEPAQTPVAIQSGPANADAESPQEPSKPAESPQAGTKEPKPEEEQVPEQSVTLTKPAASPNSGGSTPAKPEGGAASSSNDRPHVLPDGSVTAKPGDTLPVLPTDETPGKPNDETAVNPDEEASAGHSGETQAKPNEETPTEPAVDPPAKPDDGQPGTPDDPTPAEPDAPPPADPVDPNPQTPEGPDSPVVTPPEDDPPQNPTKPPEIGVVYLNEGDKETLTLTLMSTGEIVEIDITGWQEEQGATPTEYHEAPSYVVLYYAFGEQINIQLTLSPDGTVSAEASVFDPYHLIENGKENNHEA